MLGPETSDGRQADIRRPARAAAGPQVTHTCSGCDARWTGRVMAHCSAERSLTLEFAIWDRDARLTAKANALLDQDAVDVRRVAPELLPDLAGAESGLVEPSRLSPPFPAVVLGRMLGCGDWPKVLWTVVGLYPVHVVNVLLGGHKAVDHPVLVGLDVLPDADLPTEQDVTVGVHVPLRLIRRDLLASGKRPHRPAMVTASAARVAPPTPVTPNKYFRTVNTRDTRHTWILHVRALCHQTFGSPSGFDEHRVGTIRRRCLNPNELRDRGYEQNDRGVWRIPRPADTIPTTRAKETP